MALADVVEGGAGVVFGKNSDRPSGEVQEVVHVSGEEHGEGEKVQVNDCHPLWGSPEALLLPFGMSRDDPLFYYPYYAHSRLST